MPPAVAAAGVTARRRVAASPIAPAARRWASSASSSNASAAAPSLGHHCEGHGHSHGPASAAHHPPGAAGAHTSAKQASLYVGAAAGHHGHHAHGGASTTTAATPSSSGYDAAALREFVRKGDSEGYLCALLLPTPAARDAALALRAFNIEVASVRDGARGNPQAGHIRMAFWRDAVEAAFTGKPHGHPLLPALRATVAEHGLTRRWFDRLIDARDADVDGVPPPTLVALEAYGEDTAGSLLLLTLEAAGVRADAADEAAALVGRALGLTTALRALPVHARLGQRYVPDELMRVHGLSVDDLLVAPDEVRGADGRSLAEIAAALGGGGSGADGVPQQQEQQPSSSAPASARASRIPRPPPAALGAAPVNLEQQARERDELRAAAQRRLQATKAAAWGDAAGATAGAPAAPAATSTRNGVAAADIDEPRTLRMAGSRATAVAAGAGAPSAAPVAGDGFTMGSGDRQPASASAAAASRVIVVGGGSSRYSGASSAASSSAATRDFGGAPGLDDTGAPAGGSSSGGGGKVTAEAGGFASSMNRLAMISEAKAARAAARAGDLAASAAPAAAVAPAPAPAPPAVTAASSASSPSVLNSLLGRPAAPPRLVLAKDPAPQARIRSAVADMAAAAEGRLAAARSLQPSLPPGAAAALLPAVPAARFLERLRADGHDVFAPGALGPWRDTRPLARLWLQLALLRASLGGRY